ncbi:TolC family protein [uncultured Bacteroides sp.]|uniref:TolC family protein n=1 Tax=uncultured Bacteroides sp. TaxID=162156 RepID=UPI002AA8CC06|nr:TolC family protein [uncultured Bacteroides sp.]
MKTKITISAIAIITMHVAFPPTLSGQNSTKSLQECLQSAIDNNLTMQSGRISIERAKDLQGTAFNIDKTSFSLSQDPTSGGSPDNSISLSQSFDFPTAYGSRRGLLKAETKLERSNLEVTRNELVKEITSIYYQLLYARENIKIRQKQDSIYAQFLFLADAKLKSGETSRLEQMNAERLYNENKIELQNTKKSYQNIQLILQRWMNTEEYVEPVEVALSVMEPAFPITDFNPEQTPLGELYANKKIISEKNLSVVKQGYLPGFNFALKSQFLIKGFNPYNIERERFDKGNFMGFEAGISVPLFFGEQRAKTKAAKREVERTKIQQEDAMLAMRKDYQTYLNEYAKAKNTLEYYSLHGRKQAGDIIRISQISYEKGEIDYVEYIQNLKTAVEINLQYANAINDYNQTIIMLNYLQGNK